MTQERQSEQNRNSKPAKPGAREQVKQKLDAVSKFQQAVGNRAVQRLIAQRNSAAPGAVDEQIAARINQQRGAGQPLNEAAQQQISPSLGADFSSVRVHTSPEADTLNQELNARAFTTGQDIFFREGEYQPGSTGGQELIAHELTHVVQQSSGAVGGSGGPMTVNPPGDRFEQEADAVARQAVRPGSPAPLQRQEMPEEEEEMLQTKTLQRQEMPEEEEAAQA